MSRIKSIRYILSILLLFVAAVSVYFSLYTLSTIRPVSDYKDMGVYTFIPNEVYPKQVRNTATGRARRMHPTKTVYVVCYQATGSPEYKYRYEAGSIESAAQRLLVDGKPIRRRVLTIPQKDTYITIDAAETIESYSTKQKTTSFIVAGAASSYLLVWILASIVIHRKKTRTTG